MIVENGPKWNYGNQDGSGDGQDMMMDDKQEARRGAYLRLAALRGEGRTVAEKAEAAGWLLKDLVQGYDWAHSMALHTEAARYVCRKVTGACMSGCLYTGV